MHIYKDENGTDYTTKNSPDLTYESYQGFTIDTSKLNADARITATDDTSAMDKRIMTNYVSGY